MSKKLFLVTSIALIASMASGQQEIDAIAAVVGNNIVLKSEVEKKLLQFKAEDRKNVEKLRCSVLEDLLFNKLLLAQAQKDSVSVTDAQVESEMDRSEEHTSELQSHSFIS